MIYVIEVEHGSDTWFKIGVTGNLQRRLASLQTGCPIAYGRIYIGSLEGSGSEALAEAESHQSLLAKSHGGEWFAGPVDDDVLASIAGACQNAGFAVQWCEHVRQRMPRSQFKKKTETEIRKLRSEEKQQNERRRCESYERSRQSPDFDMIRNTYRK